jgi:hypothetical protein
MKVGSYAIRAHQLTENPNDKLHTEITFCWETGFTQVVQEFIFCSIRPEYE